MGNRYDIKKIHTLLKDGFSTDDLHHLCFFEPNFRPVYDTLPKNPSKVQIINPLIEYAEQTSQMDTLLAWAKEKNPPRYQEYEPYMVSDFAATPSAPPNSRIGTSAIKKQFFWMLMGLGALITFGIIISWLAIYNFFNILPPPQVDSNEPHPVKTGLPFPVIRGSAILLRDLTVHEGPGDEYAVFDTLKKGSKVEVTGQNQKGTWWQVAHPSGPEGLGWIDADYAEIDIATLPLPVVVVPPPTATPPAE